MPAGPTFVESHSLRHICTSAEDALAEGRCRTSAPSPEGVSNVRVVPAVVSTELGENDRYLPDVTTFAWDPPYIQPGRMASLSYGSPRNIPRTAPPE